jgi:hypothetical protein
MRRRLGRLLPIVMFAMLVQIFAPIAACWALSNTTADCGPHLFPRHRWQHFARRSGGPSKGKRRVLYIMLRRQ